MDMVLAPTVNRVFVPSNEHNTCTKKWEHSTCINEWTQYLHQARNIIYAPISEHSTCTTKWTQYLHQLLNIIFTDMLTWTSSWSPVRDCSPAGFSSSTVAQVPILPSAGTSPAHSCRLIYFTFGCTPPTTGAGVKRVSASVGKLTCGAKLLEMTVPPEFSVPVNVISSWCSLIYGEQKKKMRLGNYMQCISLYFGNFFTCIHVHTK